MYIAECTENIDEVKRATITLAGHENGCVCSYTVCVISAVMALAIIIGAGAYFAYFCCWYLQKDAPRIKFGTRPQWNCIQLSCTQIKIS